MINNPLHSVETCGRSNILAQHLLKTMLQIVFKKIANIVVHIGKYLVNMQNTNLGQEKFLEIDQHFENGDF